MEKYYVSTRDKNRKVSPKQAILDGICEDGGLYVYPGLDEIRIDLEQICKQSYLENAFTILRPLLFDFSDEELKDCIQKAYASSFSAPEVTPVRKVGDVYVLELFHGPTSAFKDVALTLLPQLMSKALQTTDSKAMILTATSGDTGKAALEGFKDVDRIGICVFYPHQKVSRIQYRQMVTQRGGNVKVFGVKGNFDDAQSRVKELFLDADMAAQAKKENVLLTSANSINIGRLVPQIVYYFESYKTLVNEGVIALGDPVSFSVPTGNFGDVLAGFYAYKMGLPVKKFYVASNANHVLTDFLQTGVYDRNRAFIQTISPSMDILISSNLERLLYYMSDQDDAWVKACMEDLKSQGRYTIPQPILKKIQSLFDCSYLDDAKTMQTIADVYQKTGVVLDPHSAIGYAVAKKETDVPVVSLATASPYKFSQDVLKALDQSEPDPFKAMHVLHGSCSDPVPQGLAELESLPVLHEDVIEIDAMKENVLKAMEALL